MKKISLILISVVLSLPAFNQENETVLQSKNNINILPEKGDIAIGIDAVPFLNLLNDKGTSPGFNFVNNIPAFSLKYFNTNNSALRMSFKIGYSLFKNGDDSFDRFNKESNGSFGINFGYEKRLGKSRVQGFYGFDGGFAFEISKHSNENDIVTLESSVFGIGAEFILGAEVFIMTKLSVGGQFSWGPSYLIETDISNNTAASGISLGANNANGALMLSFHF